MTSHSNLSAGKVGLLLVSFENKQTEAHLVKNPNCLGRRVWADVYPPGLQCFDGWGSGRINLTFMMYSCRLRTKLDKCLKRNTIFTIQKYLHLAFKFVRNCTKFIIILYMYKHSRKHFYLKDAQKIPFWKVKEPPETKIVISLRFSLVYKVLRYP